MKPGKNNCKKISGVVYWLISPRARIQKIIAYLFSRPNMIQENSSVPKRHNFSVTSSNQLQKTIQTSFLSPMKWKTL